MSNAPLLAMLLSGLAGGFGHCISMCGPLVAAFSVGETRQGILHHLLYNLGRITTYTILGAIVGLSGSFLVLAASIEQLQRAIMIIAGLSIIIMGLSTAEWLPQTHCAALLSWLPCSRTSQNTLEHWNTLGGIS